jgi:SH3-like domain-containing protein
MKNIVHKILFFLLVFFAGTIVRAQVSSFKSLKSEIQSLQKQIVPDKRVALLNLIVDTLKSPVIIKGETNLPEGKKQILQLLKSKGIQFIDSIRIFPDVSLGDKTWGLVTLSTANMRSEPDHATEMVSQAVMGTPLKILDEYNGWYLVQSPDYYVGWMEGNGLSHFTLAEMDRWKSSNRYIYNRITGNAFDSPNRKSSMVTDLVLGDLFEVEAEVKGFLEIRLPDGRTGFVRKKDCLSWNEWTNRKPDVQTIISVARQMLGVPYLWGGTSCKAVDCSGLTKTAYYSQGIILARDASQQARYGEHPDFNEIHNLQPGDLLFFGRSAQRITHVGIHMGHGRYIHASGMVRINSIDPKSPDFNLSLRKNLVAASRILNSLNTEGIVLVKDHPWY